MSLSVSAARDATAAAPANLCADEFVPCGGHLDNQGYLMRPRRGLGGWDERQGRGGRMEGKLAEEFGVGRAGGENRRQGKKKTRRQNQKINEVLFQWQDLCTVNITLAIRGNPITLPLLSFLSMREEIREQGGRQHNRGGMERK